MTNCALTLLGWAFDQKTGFRGCAYGANAHVKQIYNE